MSSRPESDIERLERLLKESKERVKESDRRAEEFNRRAEESDRRAEEFNRRAEESDRRAEEFNRRAEESDRRAEEFNRRAKSDRRNQRTTFEELLKACHEHLHKPITVETNTPWTTKGFTRPEDKFYPKALRPWLDFSDAQQSLFDEAFDYMHPPHEPAPGLFSPVFYYEELSQKLHSKKLSSEAGLVKYAHMAVEQVVTEIIDCLGKIEPAQQRFDFGKGIMFDDHTNSLNDLVDDVKLHASIELPQTPQTPKLTRGGADQFCVYKGKADMRTLLFVVEYKPPHKLSIGNLRAGFRQMNIQDILTRATIPTEEEAKLQYNADKLVAAVATQTFHYMIENGLEYTYISTGEAFVFLRIKEDDPTTLYYHVSVPTEDIDDDEIETQLAQTAISQVMALCLMAFRSKQRNQDWRSQAKKGLDKYQIDYEAILAQIPETERKRSPSSVQTCLSGSVYEGQTPSIKRSYHTRLAAAKKAQQAKDRAAASCNPEGGHGVQDDEYEDPDTPSRPVIGSSRAGNPKKDSGKDRVSEDKNSSSTGATSSKGKQRQYCTQDCLLGIVREMPLDENCPNVLLHRQHGNRHAVNVQEFGLLVQKQLAKDLDHDCEPLGLQGARGALFRITLTSHGYVFVGKGTVSAFVRTLRHEGSVYQHLKGLYGTAVPVCLGNIDLAEMYYLDVGVRITHMLLMSWGGQMADEEKHQEEIRRTVREVRSQGVEQGDIRIPNMLWNKERQRVMLIDFERAAYIDSDGSTLHMAKNKRALQEMSPKAKRFASLMMQARC